MLKRALQFALLWLVTSLTYAEESHARQNIIIASSSHNKALHNIALLISNKLIDARINSTLIDTSSSTLALLDESSMIISVGNELSEQINSQFSQKPQINIVTALNASDASNLHTQMVIVQPVCRQLALIDQLLPSSKKIGMITSGKTVSPDALACSEQFGMTLAISVLKPGISLHKLIGESLKNDALLTTPDRNIYNSTTVKNILLSSYRKRIPVIGFSRSFVNAGALAGIYSSPDHIADQVRRLIDQYNVSSSFNRPYQYPDNFYVIYNKQVSQSLGIRLPPSTRIEDILKQEVPQ